MKVYKLYDPRDQNKTPFYIGVTSGSLENRLLGHYKDVASKKLKSHKINKLKSLLKDNVRAKIELISEFETSKEAFDFEILTIKTLREKEIKLYNTTIGGEGWIKYRVKVFDLKGNFIEILNSCQEAADKYKTQESNISRLCTGKGIKLFNKYVFRRESDEFNTYPLIKKKSKWCIEAKKRRSERLKGKEGNRKRITNISQLSKKGELIKIWKDSKEIVEFYNLKNFTQVLRVIKGERKTFKKCIWQIN